MADQTIPPPPIAIEADLNSAIEMKMRELALTTNCHAIATIQSFDPATQSVKATINYKKSILQFNQKTQQQEIVLKDYPILADVPIITLFGGAARLTFPINPGDTCLILFNDRNIDTWITSGQIANLPSVRLHAFNDGIALVGLRSFNAAFENFSSTRAELINNNAMVSVGPEKIKVSNDTQNLNTLLSNLCSQLETLCSDIQLITVLCASPGSPSGVPANASAFAAVSSQISTIASNLGSLLE